ncbi:MAG: hypothetical protein U0174_18220 [Polyangiaceae bacterium]
MKREEFEQAMKAFPTKTEKDGYLTLSDGAHLTIHLASGGAGISVARIVSLKLDGPLLLARTAKQEQFVTELASLYALGTDTSSTASRKPAGF